MQLKRLLLREQLDFVAVQETKISTDEDTARALDPFLDTYEVCVSHAVGVSAGCFLFLRKALDYSSLSYSVDALGRFICCDFMLKGVRWRVICVYAFNDSRMRLSFFNDLAKFLDTDRSVVLFGDFNCVCHPADRVKPFTTRDSSVEALISLVSNYSLLDVGACRDTRVQYTHFQGSSHARLDRIYISNFLRDQISGYNVLPIVFSDHCLVTVRFGTSKSRSRHRDWRLWKLNTSLLNDEIFNDKVQECADSASKYAYLSIFAKWDLFKQEVKNTAIELSSIATFYKRFEERDISRKLYTLHELESARPGSFTEEIPLLKSQLLRFEMERYRGALIRSRCKRFLASEQPTRQALTEESRFALSKEITEIISNGVHTSSPTEIMTQFELHYKKLFSSLSAPQNQERRHSLLALMPRLSDEDGTLLEGDITLEEVQRAVRDLKSSKTPGPDGLPAEFYKTYSELLCPVLHAVFCEAFEAQVLPPSFLQSHTVLIPKSKDPDKLKTIEGYRPIALCNVDYKIFAKILTRRLQFAAHRLVGDHQTCGIKGRSILTNIHVARSVLQDCSDRNGQVALVQIDLAKAFDRVSHGFLFSLLEHVNIGSTLLNGVRMCYQKCSTRLIVNGTLSSEISMEASVKQGCPLSPLLFAIYLEPLLLSVLNDINISGYRLLNSEVRVLAYADDVAYFCTDKRSVERVLQLTENFCQATGAAINKTKCSGLWYGSWATMPTRFADISWSSTAPDYLGTPLKCVRNSNNYWAETAKKIKCRANLINGRDMSIFGRATACNVFLVAKLCYVLQVLHCSGCHLQAFHRIFATFIWSSSWEPMRRDNLFRSIETGGLGLVHLFVRQLVSRFIFFRDARHPFLRVYFQVHLATQLPQWVVSTFSEHFRVWGFLKEVVETVNFLSERFTLEYLSDIGRHRLYSDLIENLIPLPIYRIFTTAEPGQDVFKRVKRMRISPGAKTFFFKLHTSTLPVKTWLQDKGIFVPWSVNCRLCNAPETIEHCFLFCTDAYLFWDVLQRTIKKDLALNPYGIRFLPIASTDNVPYDLFFLLGLHSLWRCRMIDRNAEYPRTTKSLFIEEVSKVKNVYEHINDRPDWLALLDKCLLLPDF